MSAWRILSLGTTEVRVHPVVPLYLTYACLVGHGLFTLLSLASILLHELAHAACAAAFGQAPNCIEITPLGAVMRLEDESKLPSLKRALMLLAGPAMTCVLCMLSIGMTRNVLISLETGRLLFLANLSILLLNLLPALPLDGGRLATLLLGCVLPLHMAHRVIRIVSTTLGLSMVALNVYTSWRLGGWNLSLAFAGCCLIYSAYAATTTQAMAELRSFMDRKILLERQGMLKTTWISVLENQPLRRLVKHLPRRRQGMYLIFSLGSMELLGQMTEHAMLQQYMSRPDATAKDVLLCHNTAKAPKYDTI